MNDKQTRNGDGPAVLIAGFSGRALAASARRAGYLPLVVDAFGDSDTRALAAGSAVLSDALDAGFRTATLLPALDALAAASPSPPVGLVLAAGFEDTPELIATLAQRFPLLGCGRDTVAAAKDPGQFFGLLAELGIAHPEWRREAPAEGTGWLSKRIGGSGGTHIAICRKRVSTQPDRYFQRPFHGTPVSMLGVVGSSAAFAFSRQWPAPMPRRPYRYGGGVGNIVIDADHEARMIAIGLDVSRALGLAGMVSFDFLLGDGEPVLLEVNPRPGATIDLLDDDRGTLFAAHLAAFETGDPASVMARQWQPATRAAAYLYADHATFTVPDITWPDWTTDRPAAGTRVPHHAPIATVHAQAATVEAATRAVEERLSQLAAMLYSPTRQL